MPKDPVVVPKADADNFTPVEAPFFYASQFRISLTSTDMMITFQRVHPAVRTGGGDGPVDAGQVVATAVACISLQAAKDFSLLLSDMVKTVEEDYGEIVTDYTRRLKAEKK